MVLQQAFALAAAVAALAGGGTYAGYHMMQDADPACTDMEAMHGTMQGPVQAAGDHGQHDANHGMGGHAARHDDMGAMHDACHATMDDHTHNATAPVGHGRGS